MRAERLAAARLLGRHTEDEWELMLDACYHLCVRCYADEPLVRDHILPLCVAGSSDHIENIQPLCWSCNSTKGAGNSRDYRPKQWREFFGVYREEDYPPYVPGEDDEDSDWAPKTPPDLDENIRLLVAPLAARLRVSFAQ